jgi:small conductance mechanosensitive channel
VVYIVAESWADRHSEALIAFGTLVGAGLLLLFLDRVVSHWLDRLMNKRELGATSSTRLRFSWRILEAGIAIVAIAVALDQFADLSGIASALLASSAIAAAVIGFAARQVIANAVAGIMLAGSQPLRIGDLVTFEGDTGIVEDIRLTSTWLRTPSDTRIVIPNERLAAGVLRNDSIGSPTVAVEVSIWLDANVNETRALAAIDALEGVHARISETSPDGGIRLLVMGPVGRAGERVQLEGDLRRDALAALRKARVR